MRSDIIKICLLFTLFIVGCFKKQDHKVVAPEWPHYRFGGVVLDSVTKNPIDGCMVTLSVGHLLYDYNEPLNSFTYVTDSSGTFIFTGVPATDHYKLSAYKPGYYHFEENLYWVLKDSTNHRIALLRPADQPRIALYPYRGIGITIQAGTDTNLVQNICNQGHGLPLVWELSWEKTVDWISASPMSGIIPPSYCEALPGHRYHLSY